MENLTATTFVTVVLALSTLSACAGGAVRDSRADDKSTQECPLPQAAGLPTPEKTVTKHYLKVTDIRSKTTGVIAREPKYIVAAVPNIYFDGTRTALSGTVDGESYRVQDLRDGQNFEISGVSFRIAIHPDHDKVTVCQLADTPVP